MTKSATIHKFWNSFGLKAYEENSVPDNAQFPYITYQLVTDSFDNDVLMSVSLWYRSASWLDINLKSEEISKGISNGGKIILCDDGAIWVKRGVPFAQSMGDPSDDMIKRKLLNITTEYITEN